MGKPTQRGALGHHSRKGNSYLYGRYVVFGLGKDHGGTNIYTQLADGSSPMELLTSSEYFLSPSSFSPDGATLAFVELRQEPERDILLFNMQARRTHLLLNTSAMETQPAISPDGRWLAYSSDDSGRLEVYVRAFPIPGAAHLISQEGGFEPVWPRTGEQLFSGGGTESGPSTSGPEMVSPPVPPVFCSKNQDSQPANPSETGTCFQMASHF